MSSLLMNKKLNKVYQYFMIFPQYVPFVSASPTDKDETKKIGATTTFK